MDAPVDGNPAIPDVGLSASELERLRVDPSRWAWLNRSYDFAEPVTVVTEDDRGTPGLRVTVVILWFLYWGAWFLLPFFGVPVPWWVIGANVALFTSLFLGPLSKWLLWTPVVFPIVMINTEHEVVGYVLFASMAFALCLIGVSKHGLRKPSPAATVVTYDPHYLDGLRTYGEAGLIAGAADLFGAGKVNAGAEGEKTTAALMEYLLHIPGVTVFHGMQFPGSATADVDHVVLAGEHVFVVDSKQFRAGSYSWGSGSEDAIVAQHGAVYENHMAAARDGYATVLSKFAPVMHAIVLVHGERTFVVEQNSANDVVLAGAHDAINYIGTIIAADYDTSQADSRMRNRLNWYRKE